MIKDKSRLCDVCYREVASGERYIQRLILKADIPPAVSAGDGFLTVDAEGNIQMDICLHCASVTGLTGVSQIHSSANSIGPPCTRDRS